MGVPGKIVRAVDLELAQRITATWTHYVELAKRHRAGEWKAAAVGKRHGA